jgi:hypothetical protein
MSTLRTAALTVALLGLVACGDAPDRPTNGERQEIEVGPEAPGAQAELVPEWVTRLAVIANAIEERPAAADSILAAHDMTRADFESRLYDVAADPTLTRAYEAARRR